MKIAGLVKTSLIDYPGNIAAVVFTQGCNFRCGFCHNPGLLDIQSDASVKEKDFWEFLEKKKGILDGVVITGGEPTVQTDLVDFIKKINNLGFSVKLDTNGSNPKILKQLLDEKLLDYVAMDIKGPLENYKEICGYLNKEFIQTSVNLLKNSDIQFEFRTTVLPSFHKISDFDKIGKTIEGSPLYTIQGYRSKIVFDKKRSGEGRFSLPELEQISRIMKKYVGQVIIHENL